MEQKYKFLSTLSLKKYLCVCKQKWIYNSTVCSNSYITLQTGTHSAKQCDFYFSFLLQNKFSSVSLLLLKDIPILHLSSHTTALICGLFFFTMSHISFYIAFLTSPGYATPPNLVTSINLITVLLALIYRSLVKIKLDPVLVLKARH